ncbi:MAG: helix-turn-helix transcriptional regulator [Pseudomonadales bacterium]|nr:helix-turn-helix transcriptional regulator [Pseudomonadales bacterium]
MAKYGKHNQNKDVPISTKNDQYLPYREKLGERIKDLRKKRGHTQESFALDVVKMNVSYLAKIENGYVNTSVNYLIRIAKGLNVKVRDLVEF